MSATVTMTGRAWYGTVEGSEAMGLSRGRVLRPERWHVSRQASGTVFAYVSGTVVEPGEDGDCVAGDDASELWMVGLDSALPDLVRQILAAVGAMPESLPDKVSDALRSVGV